MSVRDPSTAVSEMSQDWFLIQSLIGGTSAMRKAGPKLLTRWPNEDEESYKARLDSATLFPAFGRTIEVLAGKPFSKPLSIGDDVPARLKEWCEDIDLQGRNLHTFAADVLEEALSYSVCGILIDFPAAPTLEGEAPRTVAQESALGVRPYWVQIHPQNILGWKFTRTNGQDRLTQLRLLEYVTIEGPDFTETTVEQVRVLMPKAWEVWRQSNETGTDGKKVWVLFDKGTTSYNGVPFAPVYGKRTGFMTGRPPLQEMAHMNRKHWNSQSDQDTLLHIARVPILTVTGINDDKFKLTIGSGAVVKLPMESELKFVEHTGAAIEAGQTALLALEDQMRQAGAELLIITPGNTTEAQTQSDNEQGMSALQRITNDLEDALDMALQITAEWVGEANGGHVTIYKDFGAATLAEASAELLLKMNQAGRLSHETLFAEQQRRGIIGPDVKWDEEKDRIDSQGPELGNMGAIDPLTGLPLVPPPKPPAAKPPAAKPPTDPAKP